MRKSQKYGYTVDRGEVIPSRDNMCWNRYYITIVRLDNSEEILGFSFEVYSSGSTSTIAADSRYPTPAEIRTMADVVKNAPDEFDSLESFTSWLAGFEHVFRAGDCPAIPVKDIHNNLYSLGYGVTNGEKYATIADNEEQARAIVFKKIADAADITAMKEWGQYGMSLSGNPVANMVWGSTEVHEIKFPTIDEVTPEAWAQYYEQQEKNRIAHEKYLAEQAAKLAEKVEAQ